MGGDASVSEVFEVGMKLELTPPPRTHFREKAVLARQRQKCLCTVNQSTSTSGSVRPRLEGLGYRAGHSGAHLIPALARDAGGSL